MEQGKNMEPIEITDANFSQEVLKSDRPVLIDFWATWCGPCKAIAPVVKEIAAEYASTLKVGKMDVDTNPSVPTQFNIRSIPTLLVFNKGEVVEQIMGAVPKRAIVEKIQAVLATA